ncbi:MAG TPA: alpha/beta fold hydrolase [Flavitalea sp.]|nr:alpha/beta fold hydrolase [Flavitalea sp.]
MKDAVEYKYADSNGVRIAYHERGSGAPLILLMGFGADGVVWEKHVAVYERHFRCILIDNRGVGRSDQPKGPYSTRMMAEDTIAVMNDAGIETAMVAGISMGGTIAQELAINYADRVSKLLLVSTWPKFNQYAKQVYESLKHMRAVSPPSYFTELLQLWIFAPPYYEKNIEALKSDAKAAENAAGHQSENGFNGQLDACINHDATNRLHLISCPVLITIGLMDIFTPPVFSNTLHQLIPGSALIEFPEGGHVHHWEDLETFNSETLKFLAN